MQPRICIVGASNIDLVSYVPRLPAPGETLHGTEFRMGFGGKGANQAVMAARLGADVTLVTKLGSDIFGENAMKNFAAQGISSRHIHVTDQASTGVAPIAVGDEGANTIIIVTGANDLLTTAEIEAAGPEIRQAGVLVCQLEVPLNLSLAALRRARAAGVRTILNPAPARAELPAEFYELSDIFCPNERETELLTGQSVDSLAGATSAARVLLERGAGTVILTLGERGSLIVTHDGAVQVPARRVKAVDTTGAGDAFVGSLAFYLAAGKSLEVSAGRANRIAALSVQRHGAQSSFPWASELPADLLS
jgi:ribokinase